MLHGGRDVAEKCRILFYLCIPAAYAFYVLRISIYSMKQIIINHFHIHGDYIAGDGIDIRDNQQVIVDKEHDQNQINDAAKQTNDEPMAPNDARSADILPIPPEGKYSDVRKYIEERVRFDEEFRTFVANKSRVALCKRLSDEFGWTVDHYALGRNINRNSKR